MERRRTPEAGRAVATVTGQKGPVSRKSQSIDRSGVPAQRRGLLKRSQVPELDGLPPARRGNQPASILGEGDASDTVQVAVQGFDELAFAESNNRT